MSHLTTLMNIWHLERSVLGLRLGSVFGLIDVWDFVKKKVVHLMKECEDPFMGVESRR